MFQAVRWIMWRKKTMPVIVIEHFSPSPSSTHTHTHTHIPVKFSPYLEIWLLGRFYLFHCAMFYLGYWWTVTCLNVKHFYQFNNEKNSISNNNSPHWAATTTSLWKSLPLWLSLTSARQLSATRGSHPSSLRKCLTTSSTPSFRGQALPNL